MPFLFLLLGTLVGACGWISMEGGWRGQPFRLESVCGWLGYPGFSFPCLLPWCPKRSFNQKHMQTPHVSIGQREEREEKRPWNQLFCYSPVGEQWVTGDLGCVPVTQLDRWSPAGVEEPRALGQHSLPLHRADFVRSRIPLLKPVSWCSRVIRRIFQLSG